MPIILRSFVTAVKINTSVCDRIEMLTDFLVIRAEKIEYRVIIRKIDLQSCRLVQLPAFDQLK